MAVICYTRQKQTIRGIDYRNPAWFREPMCRSGDRVVIVGKYPHIVAAYDAKGVKVTVQDDAYLGDRIELSDDPAEAVEPQKATAAPEMPLISMTKAELQAEASRLGIPYKAAASRSELLALLGGK
jgi:hypothetical protein